MSSAAEYQFEYLKDSHTKDVRIIDRLGNENEIQPSEYKITSYGADYTVELLVRRLQKGNVYAPQFQRDFVWDLKMASRFVESLLLGLPVPGIFLSLDPKDQSQLIIDGQQRMTTLRAFYDGIFPPSKKEFALAGVSERYSGKTYRSIAESDRRRLDDAIIHATIIRQDEPKEDQDSIYHIFERLNTGGRQLAPQEIRTALFHGKLVGLLRELNDEPSWRKIYGPKSFRQRDQELIVRFLAFFFYEDDYASPMQGFLNRYMGKNRELVHQSAETIRLAFVPTVELALQVLGPRVFKPQRALNAAVFDAVMVGLARRLGRGPISDFDELRLRYEHLLTDPEFVSGSVRATANEQRVTERFRAAVRAFADVR